MSEVAVNYMILSEGQVPLLASAVGSEIWALQKDDTCMPFVWVRGKRRSPKNQNRLIKMFEVVPLRNRWKVDELSFFIGLRLKHLPPEARRRGGQLRCVLQGAPSPNPGSIRIGLFWDTRNLPPWDEMQPWRKRFKSRLPYPESVEMPKLQLLTAPEDELDDWILEEVEKASKKYGITAREITKHLMVGQEPWRDNVMEELLVQKRLEWLHEHGFVWTAHFRVWMIT